MSSARGIDPLADAGRLAAVLVAVSAELPRRARRRATISTGCSARSRRIRSPWSCGTDRGATTRRTTRALLDAHRRGLGADRRAEVRVVDPPVRPRSRCAASSRRDRLDLHAPARPERRPHGGSTTTAEDRYNYLYSADELRPFADAARRPRRRRASACSCTSTITSRRRPSPTRRYCGTNWVRQIPGSIRREMVDRYPELEGIVASSRLPVLRDALYDGYDRYVRYDGSEERADAGQLL